MAEFDPERAGRRAVRKHGKALERLGNEGETRSTTPAYYRARADGEPEPYPRTFGFSEFARRLLSDVGKSGDVVAYDERGKVLTVQHWKNP